MPEPSSDAYINAIQQGIKREIDVCIKEDCMRAAMILIYCGIDAMAYLGLPVGENDVHKPDFIAWAGKYIRFRGEHQLTGEDLYGARCALLHTYSQGSKLSRTGQCRVVGHVTRWPLDVQPLEGLGVLVTISALKDAFFAGIDRFLIDAFSDPEKAPLVESRLNEFVQDHRLTKEMMA